MFDQNQRQQILSDAKRAFREIGYRPSWMRECFEFADLYALGSPIRTVDMAVFGQEPLDYRSSCFGVQFSESQETAEISLGRFRALGAPQLLFVRDDMTERWRVDTTGQGARIDVVPTANLKQIIKSNQRDWNPQAVLRAKAGFEVPSGQQIDFVDLGLLPALEHEASTKIDELVRRTCALAERGSKRQGYSIDAGKLFSLIFQLLVGKLLRDRRISTEPNIDFDSADTVLAAVRNHYPSQYQGVLKQATVPKPVLALVAQEIGNSFSFSNISVETLTYVYENTFVSRPNRRSLGIHSTPSYLADYVLAQIPIENVPRQRWSVLDPTCGHGIFLIAAMRRMRSLLPEDWSGRERHNFFAKRLHGVEIEKFSVEVARLCLMLADFPEANGWDLINQDIFAGNLLEDLSGKATIVVGNPPFEAFPDRQPLTRKPAELLRRMLPALQDGGMIGLVLPRAFLDGGEYKAERKVLLNRFELISVTGLPDRVFAHSDAETSVVVARKIAQKAVRVSFREVLDRDRQQFRHDGKVTWETKVPQQYFDTNSGGALIVPRLKELWDGLSDHPILGNVATVLTGIRYRSGVSRSDIFFSRSGPKRRLGIENVNEAFMQYRCAGDTYFSMDAEFQQNAAWRYNWDREKVIVPASRNARGPWRYAAALDRNGLCVSRRFYAVWPKDGPKSLPAAAIAALLNAPVAMAFVYTHSFQKDIPVATYETIPLPYLDRLISGADQLAGLVDRYVRFVTADQFDQNTARELLLQIDATVLRMYDLSPRMERQLLDIFWGETRRVPFPFEGYIPLEYKPWVPLHVYLSSSFNHARARDILERMPSVKDRAALELLESLAE